MLQKHNYCTCIRHQDNDQKLQYLGINKKGRPIRGAKGRKFKPTCHFLPKPLEKIDVPEPQLCDLALIETEIIESIKNSQKDSFKEQGGSCVALFVRLSMPLEWGLERALSCHFHP